MKLIREYINEKFSDESDPIRDLNIGMLNKSINFDTRDEAFDWVAENLTSILNLDSFPVNIINSPGKMGNYIETQYSFILYNYFKTYIKVDGTPLFLPYEIFHRFLKKKYPDLISWLEEREFEEI